TLYHYGSLDPWAFRLARRDRTVFIFHNVTAACDMWWWSPLVAARAAAASIQLSLFPRRRQWFAVSGFNARGLREKGFRPVQVVPCVVPEQRVAPKTVRPSLLFVGRIAPNKNVLHLLDSYAAMASQWRGTAPTLTIVGSRKRRCRYGDAF